jgi:hypothetical protein
MYQIINKTKKNILVKKAVVAESFFQRLRGFMLRAHIDKEEALIFRRTSSIHTFFMRTPIDVVFLDKDNRIIKMHISLKPGRIVCCFGSYLTVEFAPFKLSETSTEVGDILEFIPLE